MPLPVHDFFNNNKFGVIRHAPNDNNRWIVLVIAGRNVIIHNSDIPSGYLQAKIRELKALGYYAALVSTYIFLCNYFISLFTFLFILH